MLLYVIGWFCGSIFTLVGCTVIVNRAMTAFDPEATTITTLEDYQ